MQQPIQNGETDFGQSFKALNGIEDEEGNKHTLGHTTKVRFTTLGGVEVDGKVDSGATTSSLHANQIQTRGNQVTFTSNALGDKKYTLDLVGNQEVHSADGGASHRPVVQIDIEIEGIPLQGVEFNLNDRSNMDTPILLGQNVLKAGNFVIDVAKDKQPEPTVNQATGPTEAEILQAVEVLAEANLSFADFMEYMRTSVVRKLKA